MNPSRHESCVVTTREIFFTLKNGQGSFEIPAEAASIFLFVRSLGKTYSSEGIIMSLARDASTASIFGISVRAWFLQLVFPIFPVCILKEGVCFEAYPQKLAHIGFRLWPQPFCRYFQTWGVKKSLLYFFALQILLRFRAQKLSFRGQVPFSPPFDYFWYT